MANLDYNAVQEDLEELQGACGDIASILADKNSGDAVKVSDLRDACERVVGGMQGLEEGIDDLDDKLEGGSA